MLDRRTVLLSGAACALTLPACATVTGEGVQATNPWREADAVVASIRQVDIPARAFPVADLPKSGEGDARPMIQRAIKEAHEAGGGRVVLPAGLWLSDGPVHLRSHVELHISEGAHLRFLGNEQRYLPAVRTRWEGTEVFTYSPLLYAENCENVAITGPGTIDGQGEKNWLPWRKTQRPIQTRLRDMGRDGVPVEERVFVGEYRLRPHFVQFNNCRRVLVDGPRLIDGSFWMLHVLFSEDVIVRNLRCKSDHVNSDGVDPDSSRRVLIENCDFDVGDDGVAIKAGRDQDGWRVGRPSEDIVVRNCVYSGKAGGGVAIGSEMSGGVRRVYVDGFRLPKAKHTLYFKANLDRGGVVSDIFIRNIEAGETNSLLVFTNDYHSHRGGNFPPRFERFLVENVRVGKTHVGISIDGHAVEQVRDVTIRNLTMGEAVYPLKVSNAEGVLLQNVNANGRRLTLADAAPVDNEKLGGY